MLHAGDPLEKIIDECGRIAVRMSETKFQFEGLVQRLISYLGVAQLG